MMSIVDLFRRYDLSAEAGARRLGGFLASKGRPLTPDYVEGLVVGFTFGGLVVGMGVLLWALRL